MASQRKEQVATTFSTEYLFRICLQCCSNTANYTWLQTTQYNHLVLTCYFPQDLTSGDDKLLKIVTIGLTDTTAKIYDKYDDIPEKNELTPV